MLGLFEAMLWQSTIDGFEGMRAVTMMSQYLLDNDLLIETIESSSCRRGTHKHSHVIFLIR